MTIQSCMSLQMTYFKWSDTQQSNILHRPGYSSGGGYWKHGCSEQMALYSMQSVQSQPMTLLCHVREGNKDSHVGGGSNDS